MGWDNVLIYGTLSSSHDLQQATSTCRYDIIVSLSNPVTEPAGMMSSNQIMPIKSSLTEPAGMMSSSAYQITVSKPDIMISSALF